MESKNHYEVEDILQVLANNQARQFLRDLKEAEKGQEEVEKV